MPAEPSPLPAGEASPQRGGAILVFVLIIAIGLPPFASTIMIPSMAAIAEDFGTSFASVAVIQACYLFGLAVPQLLYGTISDRVGRRPAMLAGQGLFVAGTLICIFAPTVELLMVGRLVQAIGGCAGIALGRAILRDLFPREKAAAYLAYMTMAMTIGPMTAPVIGGLLQEYSGWRWVFVPLLAVGALMLVLCWLALPETNRPGTEPPRWRTLLFSFATLLRLPLYRNYVIPPACLSGSYQTFAATATFVAATRLDLGPVEFALGLSPIIATFCLGNFMSGAFGRRMGIDRMIRLGAFVNWVFACSLALAFATDTLTPLTFFGFMALMNLGQGLLVTNAVTSATGAVPGLIGSAAGLTGFLQMGAAAVFATLVGSLIEAYLWILPLTLVFLGTVGLLAALRAGKT